ncbi:MAG: hypothetical protein KDA65_06065 [Planctomycetaceae bacterium]|nr:hypothetical protein [Planctomycetaceae bacterium]
MSRLALFCFLISGLMLPSLYAEDLHDREPINYLTTPPQDPIAHLQAELESGKKQLAYDQDKGYLPALLSALEVPQNSQSLVFSKTSFQQRLIHSQNPRAIYFNDDVYIGWVPTGDVLEISAVDPQLGAVFYILSQEQTDAPRFQRKNHECLQCHATSNTRDVPGHLVRSVYTTRSGRVNFGMGTFRVDDRTPFENRWGGWYVTGTHGTAVHMGNNFVSSVNEDDTDFDRTKGANIQELSSFFNVDRYLTPHSDIVALFVLEHQTQMHNVLTQANYYGKLALHDEAIIKSMLEQNAEVSSESNVPQEYQRSDSIQRRIDNAAKRVVQSLLFCNEMKWEAPVTSESSFTPDFVTQGPFDIQGRTLRELDLQQRLFKYPCSFLIYSAAFAELPSPVLESTYRQLWEVLQGENQDEAYSHLDAASRQAILEILRATKTDLPPYWKEAGPNLK